MRERHDYTVVFEEEPEGGYTVIVPALPGCVTYGRTRAEARRMVKEAIGAYLQSLRKHGEAIPEDNVTSVESVAVGLG